MTTKTHYPIPVGLHNERTIFCARAPSPKVRPYEGFRRRVKWAHQDLGWLAEKLGTTPDDPKLVAKAIRAALNGELVLYIDKQDELADFGSPRGEASMSALEDSLREVLRQIVREELGEPDKPARILYPVRAAAEYLGVSEGSLRKKIERGQVQAEKIDGWGVRVPIEELHRLLREGRV